MLLSGGILVVVLVDVDFDVRVVVEGVDVVVVAFWLTVGGGNTNI